MKFRSIVALAFKNIINNKARFIMSLAISCLLSIVIITLGNAIFACRRSIDSSLIKELNQSGVSVEIRALDLTSDKIDTFIDRLNSHIGFEEYSTNIKSSIATINGQTVNLKAFYGGKKMQNLAYSVIQGTEWSQADNDKPYVWLDEQSNKKNKRIGDVVTIIIDGQPQELVIKGIVSGENTYLSYKMVKLLSFQVFSSCHNHSDMSVYRSLRDIDRRMSSVGEGIVIDGEDLANYKTSDTLYYALVAICGFLILLCILFSLGSVINALRMSVENNEKSIGILRAIGMSNGKIYLYVILQQLAIMLIATIIAIGISTIISLLCMPIVLTSLLGMALSGIELVLITNVSVWSMVLSVVLLTLVLLISGARVMKKYLKDSRIAV